VSNIAEEFINSLKNRIREEKIKKEIDRFFIEEALNFLVNFFVEELNSCVKSIKNYRTEEVCCYIDLYVEDDKAFHRNFVSRIKSLDSKIKTVNLGELRSYLINIKDLSLMTGKEDNKVIVEFYQGGSPRVKRIKISLPTEIKSSTKIYRMNKKWVAWIYDGGLEKIILERVDPFQENIEFSGKVKNNLYKLFSKLDDSGFYYEIISIEKTIISKN
jgi:hypothetical protein